jgi:phospholipid-transporting ATPase
VSDFVAGEFKFIKLLTLYYGREWYRKNAKLVTYSFYKNWFHVSSIVAFGAFSYFSGVVIFNVYIYELFNVIYSSWPIIIFAVFDEEYSHEDSNAYSYLYASGINNEEFNQSVFLKEIGYSIFSGVLSLLVVFYLIEEEVLAADGTTGYLVLCGSVLLGLIIIIINLKILVMSTGIRPINLVMVVASIVSYWASYAIYAKMIMPAEMVTVGETWSCATIIFVQIMLIFFLNLVEFGYRKYHEFSFLLDNKRKTNQEIEDTYNKLILRKEMSASKGRDKRQPN